ncbi:MAG: 16S rRNA (cytosine(1402)-N(4))-methyltransferase RsmH [Erysipelotrichia bacterium]|nr:16S rRNA (cytosine(1402)-N(4))-methyltransferase RsmH [Erysipelotrichia bacterium]
MLNECIEMLDIKPNGIYVDGTLGRAGHSCRILEKLSEGHLYCFDIDQEAIDQSQKKLAAIAPNFTIIHDNFANMTVALKKYGVEKVDGILLDIGVSSPQFDDPQRGFSYRYDSRLDMRMDENQSLDAYKIVNEYSFKDLVRILHEYGQEKYAVSIARNIEKSRQEKPIETTGQLVNIIKQSMPAKELSKPGHPAKQTFQALRIEVNDELNNLSDACTQALKLLRSHGRLAVITFHSLEDEIVKKIFKKACNPVEIDKRIPIKACDIPQSDYVLINKKVIMASDSELETNHRAHSAKLRVIERR